MHSLGFIFNPKCQTIKHYVCCFGPVLCDKNQIHFKEICAYSPNLSSLTGNQFHMENCARLEIATDNELKFLVSVQFLNVMF
jgi:hypothetical protein